MERIIKGRKSPHYIYRVGPQMKKQFAVRGAAKNYFIVFVRVSLSASNDVREMGAKNRELELM